MNLIQQLTAACPQWRRLYGNDPLEAALELGIIEAEDVDTPPIDFRTERTQTDAQAYWREQEHYNEPSE